MRWYQLEVVRHWVSMLERTAPVAGRAALLLYGTELRSMPVSSKQQLRATQSYTAAVKLLPHRLTDQLKHNFNLSKVF
jgi:hypothetical protein